MKAATVINIFRHNETDLGAALSALSAKLSLDAGMVSERSRAKTIELFGEPLTPAQVVQKIIADVRKNGDAAVVEYTKKLDGFAVTPDTFRVTQDEIAAGVKATPTRLRDALHAAAENVRAFQAHIKLPVCEPFTRKGATIQARRQPLDAVGVCVPGWNAAYPSTVLMTVIPARVAGVKRVAIVTPAGRDGRVRPEVLAAAHEAGCDEIYRIGGAQAVAALALGTDTIPRVDKIVGPGNAFVILAKKEMYGLVDLDMLPGPSEICIIADSHARPKFVAADLLSQAEHNPGAAALLTPDASLAERTALELERQVALLAKAADARDCLTRYGFIGVTRDLGQAIDLANQFAPEHLELMIKNPQTAVPRIRNAGAIFVGEHTPEPVGDYTAGSSHVLPTGGGARFFSGLSCNDFLKRASVVEYSREALRAEVNDIETIARAEGLEAHAHAATIRFEEKKK